MKGIGFVINHKENERRRALVPSDLVNIRNRSDIFLEKGFGETLGYSDADYAQYGVHIVTREESFSKEIVCSPKAPIAEEKKLFRHSQTIFGWVHAVQGREITDFLVDRKMTAIAWEEMFSRGRHIFWRNNEIAGEAGVMHSLLFHGRVPNECRVAVIGRGNVANGAIKVLEKLGADITIYKKDTIALLRDEIGQYDIVVNAILWDVFRKDRLIYRGDVGKMKKGAMIVDISCNSGLEIETSRPTTIAEPVFVVDGITHYAVDHTPAILYKSASESISTEVKAFIDDLIEGNDNSILEEATIIRDGVIIDNKIKRFQGRN